MENKETLAQYFSYRKDIDAKDISDIFYALDEGCKALHDAGWCLDKVNANKIYFNNNIPTFASNSLKQLEAPEEKRDNLDRLNKLAVGTYFTVNTGFRDFSEYPDERFNKIFSLMSSSIYKRGPNDEYYANFFEKGATDIYYSEYIKDMKLSMPSNGKASSQARAMVYSTPQGRAFAKKEENGFVDIIFYPLLFVGSFLLAYLTYLLLALV